MICRSPMLKPRKVSVFSDFLIFERVDMMIPEYADNAALIPKNTSLIIARVPLAHQPKKGWDPQADKQQICKPIAKPNPDTLDLSQMNGTEEDKINAMMQQSTMDYDPKG